MKEILITTTVLILCILLIRRIFHGKISSRLQYAIWLLVVLRLLIPVSAQFDLGPLSGFRLMDLVEKDESGIAERLEETIRLEEPIHITVDSRSTLFRLFTMDEIRGTMESMPEDGPTAVFMAGRLGFSWLDVLWFLWGLGAFVVGVWILTTNMVFSRRLRKTRRNFDLPEGVKEAAGLLSEGDSAGKVNGRLFFRRKGRLPAFYLAEGISSPCLYGFPGHEAVYLTTDVADDADKLRHVVVHELIHRKHGDSFWALLRGILVTVYWFHPLVWVAAVCSKRDCELACDEGALAMLGEAERISYGETLLSIITRNGRASDLVCTATTMTGSGKSVKERIRFIAKEPKIFYAAVAGVLFLIAAVCLFVFTRDARFHGITVDSQEGLTVTGADMQISLPASIGGISGCVVEKESDDVVIYHIKTQKEVGRFSRMTLADALKLVDEGREVIPIYYNGDNYLLRAYLGEPLSRTEHTYTPAGQGVLSHEDIYMPADEYEDKMDYDYLPNESINVHDAPINRNTEHTYTPAGGALGHEDIYTPVEENEVTVDYLPSESITTWEPGEEKSVHHVDHFYTPNMGDTSAEKAGTEEAGTDWQAEGGVPGTDSNEEVTYIIEDDSNSLLGKDAEVIPLEEGEDKRDYLPNEQITTTTIRSTTYQAREVTADELDTGCYVYVKADFYGKVKEKYQKEMAFIDWELKAAIDQGDQVIILSLNRKRREALFDALTQNRTPYVGDNTKVGALLAALPLPPTLIKTAGFSLQTVEQPYSLRFSYEMSTDLYTQEDKDMIYFNAAMLFYAIGNVEEITIDVKRPATYVKDSTGTRTISDSFCRTYMREEMEQELPALQNVDYEDDQSFREVLSELHIAVETHLLKVSVQ